MPATATMTSMPWWSFFVFTPWWVYLIFAVLLGTGLLATRRRKMPRWRVMITPAVFITWGLIVVALRNSLPLFAVWSVALLVAAGIALLITRLEVTVDADGTAELPGTWWMLARMMTVFVVKYGLTVAMIIRPDIRDQLTVWDVGVSGLAAGYFIGWAGVFMRNYAQERARLAPAGSLAA